MPKPTPRIPAHHERKRLAALRAYGILDTPPEAVFDDIARLAASVCAAPMAAISFVDEDREWRKASVGHDVAEGAAPSSPAAAIVTAGDPDVFVQADPFLAAAPLITPEGLIIGALSVADTRSRRISGRKVAALRTLARQVVTTLELRRHTAELHRLAGELRDAKDTIKYLALYDELTGLPRRHLFEDRLERALAGARRRDTYVAVVCLKLDGFPRLCDELGYDAGNALLKALAADLAGTLRATDTVARVGRDEFAILCDFVRLPQDAAVIGESLLAVCRRTVGEEGERRRASASLGISVGPVDGNDPQSLLEKAVAALDRRRAQGGDGCLVYTAGEMPLEALA